MHTAIYTTVAPPEGNHYPIAMEMKLLLLLINIILPIYPIYFITSYYIKTGSL